MRTSSLVEINLWLIWAPWFCRSGQTSEILCVHVIKTCQKSSQKSTWNIKNIYVKSPQIIVKTSDIIHISSIFNRLQERGQVSTQLRRPIVQPLPATTKRTSMCNSGADQKYHWSFWKFHWWYTLENSHQTPKNGETFSNHTTNSSTRKINMEPTNGLLVQITFLLFDWLGGFLGGPAVQTFRGSGDLQNPDFGWSHWWNKTYSLEVLTARPRKKTTIPKRKQRKGSSSKHHF